MLFPFLYLALSLAAGIIFASHVSIPVLASIVPLVFGLVSAWITYIISRKPGITLLFILLTTFFFGSSLYTSRNQEYTGNPLRQLESDDYIDFYGSLYKSPSRGQERDYLFMKVEKVALQKREEKIQGRLRISIPHTHELAKLHLFVQDRIKVSAKLSPSQGHSNFSPSTLHLYLKTQHIHNRAYSKSLQLVEKLETGSNFSLFRLISIVRQKLQKRIEYFFSDPQDRKLSHQGAVLEALLLGERGRMAPAVSRSLQQAGIFHLFAISGAHIAIISFLLFSFFKLLRIPERANTVLLIFILLFYALLVEGRPSVTRATIMAMAFLFGRLIWRQVNLINTLSFSAFFILILNPFQLFSLGFQLTFMATLSIILFFPKILKYLPRLPFRISEIFALSLTAQLGVLPFVAHAFNRVTFSSLFLNFVAIPLVGIIMASGYVFLLLSLINPAAAGFAADGIHFLVSLLIKTSHLLDSLSFLSFRIPTPSFFVLSGYFLFLGLFLLPSRIKKQKLVTFVCFFTFLMLLVTYPFTAHSKTLKLTFIDVGQGDSILLEFPGMKKMLVDGGGVPDDSFDVGERIVSPFLWSKGIKKIDYLILTHAHPDHMNGLKAVARNFEIKEFWQAFSPEENASYAELQNLLPDSTICRRMFRGQAKKVGRVKIQVLHPPRADPYVKRVHNDQSLVLRIVYGQTSFLLTGDIGKAVEKDLVESGKTLQCQVLKSPHHGSDTSSSELFLKAVSPQYVIISVGAGNRYNLPDQSVLERYKNAGAAVYCTNRVGAVEVSSDGQQLFLRMSSEKFPVSTLSFFQPTKRLKIDTISLNP
jgi:competence protein ComEC